MFDWNLIENKKDYQSLQLINFPDKSFLYRQGNICSNVFLIKQGIVKLTHITSQGTQITFALLKPGDITGSLFMGDSNQIMRENAQALGEVDLFRIKCNHFKKLITDRTDLSWLAITSLHVHKQQLEHKLIAILTQPVKQRVISILLELAQIFGMRCTHGFALEVFLTQQELADLVGASRSVVSTIMNNFREMGLLEYTREQICINDSALPSAEHGIDTY